jgi:micrococcal nuclease
MRYARLGLVIVTALVVGWILSYSFQTDVPDDVATERVIDGDTFIANVGGVVETVRLIGVDAPELGTCYSAQASELLATLTFRDDIWLAVGDEPRDAYGRLLAYVFHEDGTFVNLEMAKRGAAEAMAISPNIEYANLIGDARDEAAIAKRGWGRLERGRNGNALNNVHRLGTEAQVERWTKMTEAYALVNRVLWTTKNK